MNDQQANTSPSIDAGLGERERLAIYKAGTVQVVAKGEALLKRGQRGHEFSLVLNGSFDVLTNNGAGIGLRFVQGDLIAEQALFDSDPSISALTAGENSRAIVLSMAAFVALSPQVQLAALRHITAVSNARMIEMIKSLESVVLQRAALSTYLIGDSGNNRKKYEKSELVQSLLARIPRLPIHITQLVGMLLGENASAKAVADVAKQDPSLVGEVLKEVNSVHYGLRQKVSDLHYAIMLIGFNEVYQLLVSRGIRKTMPDTEEFRDLHQHAMALSCLSTEICRLCDRHSVSLLSTIGLLHDIGKSTVLLIKNENPKLAFFIQLLDPCKIGAMLLGKWNLPEIICETIECQSFAMFAPPSELPSQFSRSIGILHIAHALADRVFQDSPPSGHYPFINEYIKACGLGNKNLDQIHETILKGLKLKANTIPAELKRFILSNP